MTERCILPNLTIMLMDHGSPAIDAQFWFRILEIPFLVFVIVLAFMVSNNLKGGQFGLGMKYLAYGFLVMAIGHIHMQLDHQYGLNLFNTLLGETIGMIAWFEALIATWMLSAIGFYKIYKASRL